MILSSDNLMVYKFLQTFSIFVLEFPLIICLLIGVIYGSTGPTEETSSMRLNSAIESFLASGPQHSGKILWSMSYDTSHSRLSPPRESWLEKSMGGVNVFDNAPYDVAIDAAILDEVKAIWEKIIGEEADSQSFLRFPEREAEMATPI